MEKIGLPINNYQCWVILSNTSLFFLFGVSMHSWSRAHHFLIKILDLLLFREDHTLTSRASECEVRPPIWHSEPEGDDMKRPLKNGTKHGFDDTLSFRKAAKERNIIAWWKQRPGFGQNDARQEQVDLVDQNVETSRFTDPNECGLLKNPDLKNRMDKITIPFHILDFKSFHFEAAPWPWDQHQHSETPWPSLSTL